MSDANAIFTFLTTQLCIPHQNITNLRDREATRARIIHELEELVRKDIPRDAAILIYYAGHGTKMSIPTDWAGYHTSNGVIEAICPVDIQQPHANRARTVTPAIPDRVLNCLLHEISEAHGNNIVSFFLFPPCRCEIHVLSSEARLPSLTAAIQVAWPAIFLNLIYPWRPSLARSPCMITLQLAI